MFYELNLDTSLLGSSHLQ